MKIFEYLFDQPAGSTAIDDSSGNGLTAEINAVRAGATPARVVTGFSPPGYRFNSLRFDVDAMPTSHGPNVEPDDQLQFLRVPVTADVLNVNTTRAFSVSFWAYHEAKPDPGGNPWDGPSTLADKDLFCPQHSCGAEAFYIFVRTKNIGASVPVPERGELAFTGDGPAIVQAGGIDTTGLGGTTSNGYHVPINQWVHIACVLQPPGGASPGRWRIFVDGVLRGERDALPGLADPTTEIFSTDGAGNPRPGVDIRFGNFRGDFPGGVRRPRPIQAGANDYAFHGYLTAIRMYDHAQTETEIRADIATDTTPSRPRVNQAAWVSGTTTYRFGHRSIPTIPITGAPADTDWSRWGMLHDGDVYRMYFFRAGSVDRIYQFGWNGSSYEHGHRSIPVLSLVDAPADADASSFGMLHDGGAYRLYLRKAGEPDVLYQFVWVPGTTTYRFGHGGAFPSIRVTDFPADTDWSRWAMLHDGERYRFYAMKGGTSSRVYQGAFDRSDNTYRFGFRSIRELTLDGTPADSDTSSFAMLHDGDDYRFYFKGR